MAEALRVTVEGAEYTLDIPADSTVVRAPVQVEFFTEVDRVSAIQRAIGADVTGQWDAATNEQFSLWLRVQQATHIGIEESDGWWGPKSEAALAGHVDPDALKALSELRESGRLSKLTYRTDVHNASWEQVEGQVAERAAAPDATDADRLLSTTLNGEDPATSPSITTDSSSLLQTGAVIAAGTGAYYAGKHFINRYMNTSDADNLNTPRHFADADMDIIPRATDIEIRPAQDTLDRPFIDAEYTVSENTMDRQAVLADAIPEQERIVAVAGPEATAQDLRVTKAEIELIQPPRTIHQAQMFLPADASFMSAIQQFVQTFFPNLSTAFFGVAANSNELISKAQEFQSKAQIEIDLEPEAVRPVANTADTVLDATFATLDADAAAPDLATALEAKAAAMAAEIELDAARVSTPNSEPEIIRPQPYLAERVEIAGASLSSSDQLDAMLFDAVRQSIIDPAPPEVRATTPEFDPAIVTAAREAVLSELTSPSVPDDIDVIASQAALNSIAENNAARVATPNSEPEVIRAQPYLAERIEIAGASLSSSDPADAIFISAAHRVIEQASPDIVRTAAPEFDPAIVTAAREAAFNDLTSPSSPDNIDILAAEFASNKIAELSAVEADPYTAPIARATETPELDGIVNAAAATVDGQDLNSYFAESMEEILRTPDADLPDNIVEPDIVRAAPVEGAISFNEFDNVLAGTYSSLAEAITDPALAAALRNDALSLSQSLTNSTENNLVEPEVRYNLDDTPDIFRSGTVADFAALSVATDLPHLNIGHLTAARSLGGAFVGPADVAIAGIAGAAVLSVSDFATAQRFTAEMTPFIGGGLAMSEGRVAEGMMRFTEDLGGVGITATLGAAGSTFGPAGTIGGAALGMVATIEISNGLRDLARSVGMDVDEGMDTRELTSFLGSLGPVYPAMYEMNQGLDMAERLTLSASSIDVALKHSKYTMEGLSSEEAYARVGEDLAAQDSLLAEEQQALLDGIPGLDSLTDGVSPADALSDPQSFSDIYRYFKSMETVNPDDPAFSSAVENLSTYNELALQRVNLSYGQLMVDRMEINPELSVLRAQGPRDDAIYLRYGSIIESYDTLSAEQQEEYSWVKEAADRYERRIELTSELMAERDVMAQDSRSIAHIADDIVHADAGIAPVTSESIIAQQDQIIAQMGEEFDVTADQLREDPALIGRLEDRYIGSQDFLGSVWGNMTDGNTHIMTIEEAALLEQFKILESARGHQEFLESNPVVPPRMDIQTEIFKLLPIEETPDMSPATRMLVQAKGLIIGTEVEFAEFSLDDAQDQLDFDIRRRQFLENIGYSEESWRDAYYNIEMRPDRFAEVMQDLNIDVTKPDDATHPADYDYSIARQPVSLGL